MVIAELCHNRNIQEEDWDMKKVTPWVFEHGRSSWKGGDVMAWWKDAYYMVMTTIVSSN
jgi:endonuclease I